MQYEKLNNFQRQETTKWLLSISSATIVGGVGSYFVPGISERVGLIGMVASIILGLIFYILAMRYVRNIK